MLSNFTSTELPDLSTPGSGVQSPHPMMQSFTGWHSLVNFFLIIILNKISKLVGPVGIEPMILDLKHGFPSYFSESTHLFNYLILTIP